jgi:hypothetical protein
MATVTNTDTGETYSFTVLGTSGTFGFYGEYDSHWRVDLKVVNPFTSATVGSASVSVTMPSAPLVPST